MQHTQRRSPVSCNCMSTTLPPRVIASRLRNLLLLVGAVVFSTTFALAQEPEKKETPAAKPAPELVVVIEGQVTDAVGSGQKDVVITLYAKKRDDTRGSKLAEAKTNQYGDFELKLIRRVDGDVIVVFEKPKHKKPVREITLSKEGVIPFVAETLEGDVLLVGHVVSATGDKPVAGADVSLDTAYRERSATTDAKGAFEFKDVAPGRATIVVEAKGFGRQQQRLAATEDAGNVAITLKPERVVHIAIMDDAGDPVSGATVEVLDRPRNDMRAAVTNKEGLATISGLHFDAKMLLVRLTHEDHVSAFDFAERIDLPKDRHDSDHQLSMNRAGKIRAKVIDAETGKPIYGARVMTGDSASDDTPRDWTNESGIADITGVAPGGMVTTVHASGYAPTLSIVVVKVGETVDEEFELEIASVIKGRVEDDRGNPIPGVEIVATQWRGFDTLGLRAMTNAKGEFIIENAPDDEFQVSVRAPKAMPSAQSLQASASEIVLELKLSVLRAMAKQAGEVNQPRIGDPAPAITLTTIAGKKINLSQLRGKVVVLDFWATWCAPCVEALPQLIAINEKFKNRKDFMILGISRDFDESDLRSFLKSNPGVSWPQVVGDDSGSEELAKELGVTGIPAIFIIGTNGKIAATDLHDSQLEARLKIFLKSQE